MFIIIAYVRIETMKELNDKTLEELIDLCSDLGMKKFKAKEIFIHIHQKLNPNLEGLTTLKLEEREKIKEKFHLSDIKLHKLEKGKQIQKAAFKLDDGELIETAFMDYKNDRKTVCVSTQVGCAIGCEFCATGAMGFKRNLTVSEILSQVYFFARQHKVSNLVFMGMGEPFLNYDNVLKAAHLLNDECGLNIAARKTSISTIGIIPGIKRFTNEGKQFRLAWSLIAPFDDKRRELIDYKGIASIEDTIGALNDYQKKTKRRVMIEYVVLKDINDSEEDALELAKIAKMIDSHVNLINYNPTTHSSFKRGDINRVENVLRKFKVVVTQRLSLGQDISAACGQLTGKR
jgi:23S rRNA (adenine2503-C2)-methyltransferase